MFEQAFNKIGEIFGEIKNRIQSGYNLHEIIDHIDELRFQSQTEKHELSHLYEAIKKVAAAPSLQRPAIGDRHENPARPVRDARNPPCL